MSEYRYIYSVEEVKEYLESLGYYKEVIFLEEIDGDCMYFDATNYDGEDVLVRVDVETEVGINKWNIYESSEDYDWDHIDFIYNKN